MLLHFFLISFLDLFSLSTASHFLGGSFTYRHIERSIDYRSYKSILVELRFHISDHYFICTPEQVNKHMSVYLIGEIVLYDPLTNKYLWHETNSIKKNKNFYKIECSNTENRACNQFQEETWAYCESANQNSGYSILRRQFLLTVEKFKPMQLRYSACCWSNSTDKHFSFDLSVETLLSRNNSSPYPHIPASYYVVVKKPRDITIFAFDADGDEIICEQYKNDLGGFLKVHVDKNCKLTYKTDRIGKQFGQFWLMDRNQKQTLSRSLISVQVHVLENITCDTQSELIIQNQDDPFKNSSVIKIKQSVYILANLNPQCLLIEPQDQTITELTTLCSNNQPVVLANGGIEVIFQCTPSLCEKYQVCFVGEFGIKLPSTTTKCFLIEVIGTEYECAFAASNYDFHEPRNRHFIIAKPVSQKQFGIIPSTLSVASKSVLLDRTTPSLPKSTTSLSNTSESRIWLWVLLVLVSFLFLGLIIYFGLKPLLLTFYQRSVGNDESRLSIVSSTYTDDEPNMPAVYPDTQQMSKSIPQYKDDDNFSDSSKKSKTRSQHLRLGPLNEDDL